MEPQDALHMTAVVAENWSLPFTATFGFMGEIEKPEEPERDTACGLLTAESVKVSRAERVPVAEGVKVMLTVQPDPLARLAPQVLAEMAKSAGLVPDVAMLLILIAATPPLVSVTDCAAVVEPTSVAVKVRVVGATLAPSGVPVPEMATTCGLLTAESVKVSVAVRDPVADGENVRLTKQSPEPGRLVPQVLDEIAKSEALAPEMRMLLILMTAVPPLLSVTDCAAVVEPTEVEANVRLAGVTLALALVPAPVPERATD